MKGSVSRQKCAFAEEPAAASETKLKCVTVMVFEEAGKTIIQPLVLGPEAHNIQELFQNKTLEVWLSNGEHDPAQFDVAILKYKQQMQPSKMCIKNRNCVCLKNHLETVVSCEQCPLNDNGA